MRTKSKAYAEKGATVEKELEGKSRDVLVQEARLLISKDAKRSDDYLALGATLSTIATLTINQPEILQRDLVLVILLRKVARENFKLSGDKIRARKEKRLSPSLMDAAFLNEHSMHQIEKLRSADVRVDEKPWERKGLEQDILSLVAQMQKEFSQNKPTTAWAFISSLLRT